MVAMRAALAFTILLVATVLVPMPAASASAAGEEGFLTDPAGDTALEAEAANVPVASAQTDNVDLLSLDVEEAHDALSFTLAVTSLDQAATFSLYEIRFTWRDVEFGAMVRRFALPTLGTHTSAYLIEAGDDWNYIAELEHEVDETTGTITLTVPKPYILDGRNRMPLQGDQLKDVHVIAEQHVTIFSFTGNVHDRMPDDGTAAYAIQLGDYAVGHLRLETEERLRVSNGGATTFVYQAELVNRGEVDDEVDLTMESLPEGWNGTVRSPVRVPAGESRTITVLASVPFAHDHGGFDSFNLTARSRSDADAVATIRLGVLHTPIPQPAGHHDELYLHAEAEEAGIFGQIFPWTRPHMNTVSDHANDVEEVMVNDFDDGAYAWWIPLNPDLRMGLDFDLARTGTFDGAIVGHGTGEGTVSAEMYLLSDDGDELLLATSDEAAVTLDVSNPAPFSLVVTPTEDADYVPHRPGQNAWLLVKLDTESGSFNLCCISGTTPAMRTADFKLKLPLNEYHDRLTGAAAAAEALRLETDGPVEKTGRPGTVLTYRFKLTNGASTTQTVQLDVAGTDATAGTVVPGGAIELAARESVDVTLAVEIPAKASDGQELEVLVFAHAKDDPTKTAIARTKTSVARTGDAMPDESDVLLAAKEAQNDTPAPGVGLLTAVLATAALASRRARRPE